jgi:hypothetical protein
MSGTDGRSVPPSRTVRACRCLRVVRAEKSRHVPPLGPTDPSTSPVCVVILKMHPGAFCIANA